ncbi:DUF3795 domain-containing protein [Thermoproteota archaeon]
MESPFDVKNQVGPCGITCGTCFLGDGSIANSAKTTIDYINMIGIKEWAPMVPDGSDLNWDETEKTLNWMTKYAYCDGCEKGGGPPNCTIRICANEKGHELCNMCSEIDECNKFDWLGEGAASLKRSLTENMGKSKKDLVKQAMK